MINNFVPGALGRGVWEFKPAGPGRCDVVYDWQITAAKPLLKLLTPVLWPAFSANHHWAMRMGEQSLRLELQRHRARTPEERAAVPAAPGPAFPHNLLDNRVLG
ncbi:MAG: hypothetical protein H6559_14600 [Lewinellaceae bacterium]|nr:hypothetical protein [Lewinellaceae bacterium]